MNKKAKKCTVLIIIFALSLSCSESLACTIFTLRYDGTVLFGNNEDYSELGYIWFVPPTADSYGAVYVGFRTLFAQGGMNEKGLCFDVNSLAEGTLNSHPELPSIDPHLIMEKCATVAEVIEMAKIYNWGPSMPFQVHLADATGDAVVISPGADGELCFTRKTEGDGYLISTNFNLALARSPPYPCWRYNTALAMLSNITNEESLTVGYASSILDATHQDYTAYSSVFDPQNLLIYLYYNHNYNQVVTYNLTEEMTRDSLYVIRIKSIFEGETFTETSEGVATFYGIITAVTIASIAIILKRNTASD